MLGICCLVVLVLLRLQQREKHTAAAAVVAAASAENVLHTGSVAVSGQAPPPRSSPSPVPISLTAVLPPA